MGWLSVHPRGKLGLFGRQHCTTIRLRQWGGSNTEFAAGGAVGYRAVVSQHVAVGVEGGYRRWFDLKINEIVISLKLGVVFP